MHQESTFSSVVKKMVSLKASNKTFAATVASKYKYKSLHTSSFLKASLKTNNKALVESLQIQKEISRHLEKEIVCLQKEVQSLHLDMANGRRKHKNLILILKDLHSSALHHLGRVAEFVSSDIDDGELFHGDESPSPDADDDYIQMERQTSVDLTEENNSSDLSGIENITNDMEMHLSKDRQRETICHSTNLEEKSSQLIPESGSDVHPVPRLESPLIPSVVVASEKPRSSVPDNVTGHPSNSATDTEPAVPEHCNELDRTMLLNTPMEMTISDGNSEMVTVETKPKKRGRPKNSDKPKEKKERRKMKDGAFVEKDNINDQKKQLGRSCEDEKPRPSVPDNVIGHPSNSATDTEPAVPEHCNELDRTMLLNTPMEMISDGNSEMVTVETKPKKRGRPKNSDKPKEKKERRKMKDGAFVETDNVNDQKKQLGRSCEDEKSGSPVPDNVIDHPSSSDTELPVLEHGNELDRTMLLDTPKQKERLKMKDGAFVKMNKVNEQKKQVGRSCEDDNPEGGSSVNLDLTEMQRAPVVTLLQTDLTEEAVTNTVATETKPLQRNTHISRIPKLSKVCDPPKPVKDHFRHHDSLKPIPVESKCHNTVSPEQDHFVESSELEEEGAILLSEKDIAKEESSKTKSCKTYVVSKLDKAVTRGTFVITSYLPSQSDDDESEERENESDNAAHKDQPLYEEFLAYTDDHATQPEVGHTRCPPLNVSECETTRRRSERCTDSTRNLRRCRETFLVSVTRDSSLSNNAASEPGALEPHFNSVAEESETFKDVCVVEDVCEQSPQTPPPMRHRDDDVVEEAWTTGKRSWLATQEPANVPEDLRKHNHDMPPFPHPSDAFITDHRATGITEVQKLKKARTEDRGRSSKKKTTRNEEPKSHVNSRRRKTNKKNHSTQGFRPHQDDVYCPLFSDDILPYDVGECADGIASPKPIHTQNRCGETCVIEATSPQDSTRRNRVTFFVPSCITQKSVSIGNIRTSNVSVAEMCKEDASRAADSLRDFLLDERPPWEGLDVSTSETDMDCLVSNPRRLSPGRVALYDGPTAVATAEASPAGRAMTSLTNTILTPDNGNARRARGCKAAVSYKEPTLNSKMRRSDAKVKKTKKKSKRNREEPSQS